MSLRHSGAPALRSCGAAPPPRSRAHGPQCGHAFLGSALPWITSCAAFRDLDALAVRQRHRLLDGEPVAEPGMGCAQAREDVLLLGEGQLGVPSPVSLAPRPCTLTETGDFLPRHRRRALTPTHARHASCSTRPRCKGPPNVSSERSSSSAALPVHDAKDRQTFRRRGRRAQPQLRAGARRAIARS